MVDYLILEDEEPGAAHSMNGPSGAYRWMNCTASPQFFATLPRERNSSYAAEGSAAHALLERCLAHGEEPWEHAGKLIDLPDSGHPPFMVDDEMVSSVTEVTEWVHAQMAKYHNQNPILLVERRVRSSANEHAFGTADVIILVPRVKMIIADLKYGKGKICEPDEPQTKIYGHYTFETFDTYNTVADLEFDEPLFPDPNTPTELYILQPRAFHPEGTIRGYETTKGELSKFFYDEVLPAMQESQGDSAKFAMGSWCAMCPGALTCPLLNAKTQEFTIGREPVALDDKELGEELHRIETILKARQKVLEAEALRRAMLGREVPHYKLVRQIARRIFKESMEVEVDTPDGPTKAVVTKEQALEAMFGDEAWEPRELISPAKAEKLPGGKAFVKTWGMTPQTGLTLAPETDRRAAQKPDPLDNLDQQEVAA